MIRSCSTVRHLLAATSLAALLVGCGSQIDDIPTPDVRATQITPGGIYQGQITSQASGAATPVTALVDDQNRIVYFADDASFLAFGMYTALNSGVTAQLRSFSLNGDPNPLTLDFVGSFQPEAQTIGSYTRQDGDAGSIDLTYIARDYETRSALALLEGKWGTTDAYAQPEISFSFDSNGGVFGQVMTTGCKYNGNIALVDLRFNVYRIALTETCGASPIDMIGLASLLPADASGATPQQLVLAVASSTEARLFRLGPGS